MALAPIGRRTSPDTRRKSLVAIDDDPAGKGNDFVISYGDEQAPSRHTVAGPVALWQAQDQNGVVVSLEIKDERGGRTIVTLA